MLPDDATWEYHRDDPEASECPGHIDGNTGRCGGFCADSLWEPPPPKKEIDYSHLDY